MKIVLLAAGKGERLAPLTNDTPKPLLLWRGKPVIDYALEVLEGNEIAIVIGYLGEKIQEYYGDKYTYILQKEQTGDAGALYCAKNFVGDDPIFACMNADVIIPEENIKQMLQFETCLIACYTVPFSLGVIEHTGIRVNRLWEKPMILINAGFYILPRIIFPYLKGHTRLAEVIDNCLRMRLFGLQVFKISGWKHITLPSDLQ